MSSLKITEVFKSFSPEELKQFEKNIRCENFNPSRLIEKYFLSLKKYYPDFDSPRLTKEFIYKKIYRGKIYNDQIMRNLNSEMMRLIEEFFLMININRSRLGTKINIIDELQYRGLFGYSLKMLNQLEKDVENDAKLYDKDFFYLKYNIEYLWHQQYLKSNKQDGQRAKVGEGVFKILHFLYGLTIDVSDNFVGWYNKNITQREDSNTLLAKSLISNNDFISFIENIKRETNINPFAAEVFLCFVNALTKDDGVQYFFKLKELVLKNINDLNQEEKVNLFDNLFILSTKLHNLNGSLDKKEMFEIVKLSIEHKAYKIVNEYSFRIKSFRSILMSAISANELEWLEKFIADHIEELPKEHKENMLNFSLAHLYFSKKQFGLSLEHLSKVEIIMFAFKADIKVLQLLLYFELGYYEEAISLLDSFRHFMSTNKNYVNKRKDSLNKFIYFYNGILKMKIRNNLPVSGRNGDLEILKHELVKCELVRFKEWLLEKMEII